jgi:hypothetical protein
MTPLQEDNYIKIINSYTIKDWQPLLELIPEIQTTEQFEEDYIEPPKNEDGSINFPHVFGTEIVSKFLDVVYNIPIAINFDWGEWEEGKEIINDETFDYDTIDIPTKCKIITTIVRADRFSEGFLVRCFESGLILKVLKSIKSQISRSRK